MLTPNCALCILDRRQINWKFPLYSSYNYLRVELGT